METKQKGWVITAKDGKLIFEASFSRTRRGAIDAYMSFWDFPKKWIGHKARGLKCVKALRTIEIIEQ